MAAHPQSAVLKALARSSALNDATLRPPRSRLERATVKRMLHWSFEALNRRDLDAAFALLPSKFEWEFVREVPGMSVARSPADVRHLFDEFLAEFPDYNTHIEEYSDDGRRIVMRVHAFNPAPHTGLEMNMSFFMTWDYEDGVHRIRERLIKSDSGITELIDAGRGAVARPARSSPDAEGASPGGHPG